MPEPIYHVYANYCGKRRLLFTGYASRVARRIGMNPSQLAAWNEGVISIHIPRTTDRFGNAMPYQLWTGPATLWRINELETAA